MNDAIAMISDAIAIQTAHFAKLFALCALADAFLFRKTAAPRMLSRGKLYAEDKSAVRLRRCALDSQRTKISNS